MKKIKVGLIGLGDISNIHINAIADIPHMELAAVCTRNEEKAKKKAKEIGCKWYTDYREMITQEDIDAVDVCTPSGARKDIVVFAAQNKKHIITEKPIEVTLERIDEMLKACEENNVYIASIFHKRFTPIYSYIKNIVEEGRIGKAVMGDVVMKWYRPKEYYTESSWRGTFELDGGGALMNQCIHFIDLIQWIMGGVKSLYGNVRTLVHDYIETEDTAAAVFEYNSGAIGVIEAATSACPGFSTRLTINGSKGGITVENDQIIEMKLPDERPQDKEMMTIGDKDGGSSAGTNIKKDYSLHMYQLSQIADALIEGRQPPVSGYEARKAVEIITAVYESSKKRLPIDLKQ